MARRRSYYSEPRTPAAAVGVCGKKVFRSERHARAGHRFASFRLGIYYCTACLGYHVRNEEKR